MTSLRNLCLARVADGLVDDEIRGKDVHPHVRNEVMSTICDRHPAVADHVIRVKFSRHFKKLEDGTTEQYKLRRGVFHGMKKIKKGRKTISKVRYVDGKRQGIQYEYNENGHVTREIPYENDVEFGIEIRRGESGNIIRVVTHGICKCHSFKHNIVVGQPELVVHKEHVQVILCRRSSHFFVFGIIQKDD